MLKTSLGTAQLGLKYGAVNHLGQPDLDEARAIVKVAWESGCRHYDTARAYGQSERVLGQVLHELGLQREALVTTKLSLDYGIDELEREFNDSVEALGVESLYGLLLHREVDLDRWDHGLGDWLLQKRKRGLVHSVGVSVYTPEYALKAIQTPGITAVQIPMSVFDRKMIRNLVVEQASRRGVALFIRSIYLQGLAVVEPEAIPEHLPFAYPAVCELKRFCTAHGIERIRFALEYVTTHAPAGFLLVGAETAGQARANCDLIGRLSPTPELARLWDEAYPEDDPLLANPANWPKSR